MRHIAHAESLFAGSISTRANAAGAVRSCPRHAWRARTAKHEGELVPVRIISTERGKPPGTLADGRWSSQPSRPAQPPQAGRVRRLGASRCGEKRDESPAGSTPCTEYGGMSCSFGPRIE